MRSAIVCIGKRIRELRRTEGQILTCGFAKGGKLKISLRAHFGASRCTQSHFSCILDAADDTKGRQGPPYTRIARHRSATRRPYRRPVDRRTRPASLCVPLRRHERCRRSAAQTRAWSKRARHSPAPENAGGRPLGRPPRKWDLRPSLPGYAITRQSAPSASSGSSTCCGST